MNRHKMGSLGYDVIARYGLNDMHCILIFTTSYIDAHPRATLVDGFHVYPIILVLI